jgi:predicted PurR-regulated permease PerM
MQSPGWFDYPIRLVAVALLSAGCFFVLQPFITALLLAAVVAATTWPLFTRLRRAVGERPGRAALIMMVLLILVVVLPLAVLAASFAGNVTLIVDAAKAQFAEGVPPSPAWLATLPLFGADLAEKWQAFAADPRGIKHLAATLAEPARKTLLALGAVLGDGVFQMLMVAFIGFFFYRDGEAMLRSLRSGTGRIAGRLSGELLESVQGTVVSVVYGILGTALIQAAVAVIGFLIAGVSGALVLGAATFFLSLIPGGPVLVWGGAAIWLYYKVSPGWAAFMVVYGVLVISSIDNFVKPMLISRGSDMSLLVVVLGVFGGLLAFGFVGIFLGPVLLVIGLALLKHWLRQGTEPQETHPAGGP